MDYRQAALVATKALFAAATSERRTRARWIGTDDDIEEALNVLLPALLADAPACFRPTPEAAALAGVSPWEITGCASTAEKMPRRDDDCSCYTCWRCAEKAKPAPQAGGSATPPNDPRQAPLRGTEERRTWDRAHQLAELPLRTLAEESAAARRALDAGRPCLDWSELVELAEGMKDAHYAALFPKRTPMRRKKPRKAPTTSL
jgi:hypothetical protein